MKTLSWLKLAQRVWSSNFERLGRPYKLNYVVTKECHSKCLNCKIWQVKPKDELLLHEIEDFVRRYPHWSWVEFTGGEPTDRKDFVELVSLFIRHCPDLLFIHFPTNGLKPKRIEQAAQAIADLRPPRFYVTVSIDGPPEVNNRLRGIPKDFSCAVETYRRLRTIRGVKPVVGMTLYQENYELIDQTCEAVAAEVPGFDIGDLHVNLPNVSEHFYGNADTGLTASKAMLCAIEKMRKRRGLPKTAFDFLELLYQRKAAAYLETRKCPQVCAALLSSVYLSETGVVYPCAMWNAPLGSLRECGYCLSALLEQPRRSELRSQVLVQACPNCWTPCEAYQTIAANLLRRSAYPL